jgi:hypothetical protein
MRKDQDVAIGSKKQEAVEGADARPPLRGIRGEELRRAEEVRNCWRLTLRRDIPYAALLGDEAATVIGPIAPFLTMGDRFEVVTEAGDLYADLLLVELAPGGKLCRFVEILKVDLGGRPIDSLEGTGVFRAGWLGWVRKWAVVAPNGSIVREGIASEAQAVAEAHPRNAPSFARSTLG